MVAKIPMTKKRRAGLARRTGKTEKRRTPARYRSHCRGACTRRPQRKRRIPRAREQQGFVEGRIRELEHKLSHANVIDVTTLPQNGKVVFGTTVELEDSDSGEEMTYKIVGEDEADIKAGLISNTSPIARALLGKEEGETVEVVIPDGRKMLEILAVRYEA